MSDYTYTDGDGDELRIRRGAYGAVVEGDSRVFIDPAVAPTVAAELLKAAGRESVIVPKSPLVVQELPDGAMMCGSVSSYEMANSAVYRRRAAENIAIAEHLDAKAAREAAEKAEAEAAGKKLQERRDALATKFLGFNVEYHSLEPSASLRPAIDYALELEDKLGAAK